VKGLDALKNLRIFHGNATPELAKAIAKELHTKPAEAVTKRFADGEVWVDINESVRGKHAFIVQSTCKPVNDSLMELLVIIDALKRATVLRVTAVIPYYGYGRQDKKASPREPISARLVANLIEKAGADDVLSVDLHSGQTQGFFQIPVDNLTARPLMVQHARRNFKNLKDVIVVSPDAGGAKRAQEFANALGTPLAIIHKTRPMPNRSQVTHVVGYTALKTALLYDDIVDTAGSLANAADALAANGTKEVYAYCTHAVLSDDAVKRIRDSKIKKLIVTDSIPLSAEARACKKIEVVSLAPLIAQAIERNQKNMSVSELFRNGY